MGASPTRLFLSLFLCLRTVSSLPAMVFVGEKEQQCFYKSAEGLDELVVKVFVFKGGSLDIGLTVRGPFLRDEDGHLKLERQRGEYRFNAKIVSEPLGDGRGDAVEGFSDFYYEHKKVTPEDGEYEICLSNDRRFKQEAKHVIMEISAVVEGGGSGDNPAGVENDDNSKTADLVVIADRIKELEGTFSKIEALQTQESVNLVQRKSAVQDIDASMAKSSVMETIVLLVVGIAQIVFVRRWFQGKETLLKQWA